MDVAEKMKLVSAPPTEEIITAEDIIRMFETNDSPKHYIGLEISGFLHLGSLLSTGYKINDFVKAGMQCTVFLADWHTMINDKLDGRWETIAKITKYYKDAFNLVCPGARIVLGTDLYEERRDYWQKLIMFTKHMSLARTIRTLTITGRSEDEERIKISRLFYPPMQAVDIHSLDVDLAHAGMDQRKIHMLVREVFPKMGWKVPVAVHHGLLPGLSRPSNDTDVRSVGKKMSKSDPDSSVFIHDTDDDIKRKIRKAWCEEGMVPNNPVLAIAKTILFHENREITVERPGKFGGNVTYENYDSMEAAFGSRDLHPMDLKRAVGDGLVKIISPIRDKLTLTDETSDAIRTGL